MDRLPDRRGTLWRRSSNLGRGDPLTELLAAVIGREFDLDLLAVLADVDEDSLMDVLDMAGMATPRHLIYPCCQAPSRGRLRSDMAKLIYVANVSLDGYIEDAHGRFDWTEPSDEYFTFITDLVRPVGTYLYGRRLYETMAVWEADPTLAAQSELMADFANVWQGADKIVYSTTLHAVSTNNARLERRFDPDSVREMKASAASDLTVGGATLAAHAFNAGLVDECQLFMYPVIVGEGKPAFPSDARVQLDLLEEHRFGNGVVHLRYRTQS